MDEKQTYPDFYDYSEEPLYENLNQKKPRLSYTDAFDFDAWRKELKESYIKRAGLDVIASAGKSAPELQIEYRKPRDGYTEIRLSYQSEEGYRVPAYLLIPDGDGCYPVAICLQGHSTGFHNSIGEIRYEDDISYQPRGAFGVQAVRHGYAAFCIEQRAMGERRPNCGKSSEYHSCNYMSMKALLHGRTTLGERVWDIHRGIDVLEEFFLECNTDEILITGNSGGGTASFYAACYDERIKVCAPSCSFCSYETSILSVYHCPCNYLPGAMLDFEMHDLAGLIFPRDLHIITGESDHIFPLHGVKDSYEVVKRIYAHDKNAKQTLSITPKGHWWCEGIVWGTITKATDALGWKRKK